MKLSFAIFLLISLVIASSFLQAAMADPIVSDSYCTSKCNDRCAKAGVSDRCMKYCGICCAKCNCVPSGTYGNKHECPCYRDQTNKKGKPKCP